MTQPPSYPSPRYKDVTVDGTIILTAGSSGFSVTAAGSTTSRPLTAWLGDVVNAMAFGAKGDGTTDDSIAIDAACTSAIAAGQRYVFFPDGNYLAMNLTWGLASGVHFIGNGSTLTSNLRKYIVPQHAPLPSPPERTIIPALHLTRMKAAASPVVVVMGDSITAPMFNQYSSSAAFFHTLCQKIRVDNPGKSITFHDRGIGAQGWAQMNAIPSSFPSWYTDHTAQWLSYIQALSPDLVVIHSVVNDASSFLVANFMGVLNKIAAFTKVPDVIVCTSTGGGLQTTLASANSYDNVSGFMRSYCAKNGIGLIDFHRRFVQVRDGWDPIGMPLKLAPTLPKSGLWPLMPYTMPTCRDWGVFLVPGGSGLTTATWATWGNEWQFQLGVPTSTGEPGNVFRLGLDTTSGNIYYQADTTSSRTSIPKTITNIPGNYPTSNGTIEFWVRGNQATCWYGDWSTSLVYSGPVERFSGDYTPVISNNATPNTVRCTINNPMLNDRLYTAPLYTSTEIFGPVYNGAPTGPYGGTGDVHPSTIANTAIYEPVIYAQNFCLS